jgi:hypothetical protein
MVVTSYEFKTWEKFLLLSQYKITISTFFQYMKLADLWETKGLKLHTQECSTSGEEVWGWRSGRHPKPVNEQRQAKFLVSGPSLTLSLLMSYIYIYMELLVKPEILTSYVYGPTFGSTESHLFLFAAQCFNTELTHKVILWHSCV